MKAGIVYYRRKGNALIGQWTHENIGGLRADEVVKDVEDNAIEGKWPVEIFAPNGDLMFTGHLESVKFGHILKLEWTGTFCSNNAHGRFVGLGMPLDSDLIVASFEKVDEET